MKVKLTETLNGNMSRCSHGLACCQYQHVLATDVTHFARKCYVSERANLLPTVTYVPAETF